MNIFVRHVIALAYLTGIVCSTTAQSRRIIIHAVDAKSGKPLVQQHLLIFGGQTEESVRQHQAIFELTTDQNGAASLILPSQETQWIQVLVDWHVVCKKQSDSQAFSVDAIISEGVSAPNRCGKIVTTGSPGNLFVFVRPETFWERMRH